VLRAVLVTPLSGPLARFGTDGAHALDIWARATNTTGPVALDIRDAHPDAAAAMRAGVGSRPDLVFGPYGSGPVRVAARATDRLLWNHGGASVEMTWDRFPHVINVLSPPDTYLHGTIEAVRDADPAAESVTLLHVDTGFGRAVAEGASARATDLGFDVTRIAFARGQSGVAARDATAADVLCVAAGFEDELELGRALLPGRWRAACFVGAGEREILDELGALREGLSGPCQWLAAASAAPEIGPRSDDFVEMFRAETGRAPSYPAAQAFAAGVLASTVVERVGSSDDAALKARLGGMSTTTLFGGFRLDTTGRQVGHRVLTVQWQGGRRRVVWPTDRANARLALRGSQQ
jgi:branched-chain amino acid transport system substrate-binding protein